MTSIYTDKRFSFMWLSPLEKYKENYHFVKTQYLDLEMFFLKRLDIKSATEIRKSWEEWKKEDYLDYKELCT